jgi:flagellin-specific chaperone FliS
MDKFEKSCAFINAFFRKILRSSVFHFLFYSIITISLFYIAYTNIKNNETFFHTSISNVLALFIAVFFSFVLTQIKVDRRLQIEEMRRLMLRFVEDCEKIADVDFKKGIDNEQKRLILRKQHICDNDFAIIRALLKINNFSDLANTLHQRYEKFTELLSDVGFDKNYENIDALEATLSNVRQACNLVTLRLFEN